jgi:hypothetical protein
MLRIVCLVSVLSLALASCGRGTGADPVARTTASGPASVRTEVVLRHARQFEELGDRPAGSQSEFAAATYITGHLQQAGYVVRLDAVPVENLVRSSNVVALPPSPAPPEIVVTAPYDTGPASAAGGDAVAVLLEVARALRVAAPDHRVEFVALGAEFARSEGGSLGSRRAIRVLQEEDASPQIVQLLGSSSPDVAAEGPAAGALCDPSSCDSRIAYPVDPFMKAGFDRTLVDGPPEALGPLLLDYLEERSR